MNVCEVTDHVLANPEPCRETETREYIVGCVHEHVRRRWVCARHADTTRRGTTVCRPCRMADGHLCPQLIQPAPTINMLATAPRVAKT